MQINNIFSNFLAFEQLDLDYREIEKYCYEKFQDRTKILNESQYWLTPEEMKENLAPLYALVNYGFNEVHNKIGLKDTYYQEIKEAWVTMNNCYHTSIPHSHPSAFLSAVYYVKTPKNCGNIEFMTPIAVQQHIVMRDMIKEYNEYTSSTMFIEPKAGTLVIFPSWLIHYVNANMSGDDRISIAFNSDIHKKAS